eukprot:TRINITY_DN25194_c0_g2_i1.p3 TRINITY_DN25194_c0_g2~~TRINITY_DN25194_c0_g2_i1.p3  ORF type:complete len:274 (+),score=-2.74 TRINITY_DN25194_c0_g2_i1:99-920(+)
MFNLAKSVVFYSTLAFLFSIIQVLIVYQYWGGNANECFSSLIQQRRLLTKDEAKKESDTPVPKSTLFILILSSNQTTSRRKVVRDTWATQSYGLDYNYAFVLAHEEQNEDILLEKQLYKDIIILNGISGEYRQLTDKLLRAIIYCHKNFHYEYLVKTDDDSFVNVKALLQQIDVIRQQYNDSTLIFAGALRYAAKVQTKGKWRDHQFRQHSHLDNYPPYMQGGCLVCWNSSKQKVVATSTTEAEFISCSLAVQTSQFVQQEEDTLYRGVLRNF